MEIVTASSTNGVSPFHDHDVREWSRINSLTGVFERARIETDHWTANTNNSVHKYGKVVDSRARTDADGALRQQARRQLEVFQSQLPGVQLQVIKTHTVSSSRWTSSSQRVENDKEESPTKDFESLQVSLNQLDLSSQKAKASIGRSVFRRPPTRKPKEEPTPNFHQTDPNITASINLQKVTRLCHEVHENAVRQAFAKFAHTNDRFDLNESTKNLKLLIDDNAKGNNKHTNLCRTKSTSSEDIFLNNQIKTVENFDTLEQQNWKRSSKIRRSLQHLKSNKKTVTDISDSVNVRKITEDFEKGKQLNVAIRPDTLDIKVEHLMQPLQTSFNGSDTSQNEKELVSPKKENKRNSIVTEESLQEIKSNLRRVKTPVKDLKSNELDSDDGIVTEEAEQKVAMKENDKSSANKVKSYVFGMESAFKKTINGTGSLESRAKVLNGVTANRTDDWYNRRKSYGFEPVQNENESILKTNTVVESSTDSGICKSNEIIVVPSTIENGSSNIFNSKENLNNVESQFSDVQKMNYLFDKSSINNSYNRRLSLNEGFRSSMTPNGVTIKIPIVGNKFSNWQQSDREVKRHSIAVDETKYVHPKRTSLIINDTILNLNENDATSTNKKPKKVEFCKTEVHFAAESGKVNIVETDEKPPPTQNFRRRRRHCNNISPTNEFNKNGLPVLHFGENLGDKMLFESLANFHNTEDTDEEATKNEESEKNSYKSFGIVTVNSDLSSFEPPDDDKRETLEPDSIKGILKNKIAKPKPYLLGHNPFESPKNGDNSAWRKLYDPYDTTAPIWKSTVTLSNAVYNKIEQNKSEGNKEPVEEDKTKIENQPDLIKDQIKYFGGNHHRVKIIPSTPSLFSMSVADRVKQMEETQKQEHGGYSTKVNFGEGQAFVIENSKKENVSSEGDNQGSKNAPQSNGFQKYEKNNKETRNGKYSPIVLRKQKGSINKIETKTAHIVENLSSPSLVGRNMSFTPSSTESNQEHSNYMNNILKGFEKRNSLYESHFTNNDLRKYSYENQNNLLKSKKLNLLGNAPQIVTAPDVCKDSILKESKIKSLQSISSHSKTDPILPEIDYDGSPIYENVASPTDDPPPRRTFDSAILEELTKAADEILQTVNESSNGKFSSSLLNEKEALLKTSKLTTINENKSWKPTNSSKLVEQSYRKNRLCRTASNSSLESNKNVSKNDANLNKKYQNKTKTKTSSSEGSSIKAATKARRIQRASSREALLHSRGSSSDDINNPIEPVPVRKPRVTKKKSPTSAADIGADLTKRGTIATNAKRKDEVVRTKMGSRVSGALPEIRHKTAISSIRSTAEKSLRDKGKPKMEEQRKKCFGREVTKGGSPSNNERSKGVSPREVSNIKMSTTNARRYRLDGCIKN